MKVRMIKEDGQPIVEVSYSYGMRLIEQHLAELVDGDTPVTPTPPPERSPVDIRFEDDEALIGDLTGRVTVVEGALEFIATSLAYDIHMDGETLVISTASIHPDEDEEEEEEEE